MVLEKRQKYALKILMSDKEEGEVKVSFFLNELQKEAEKIREAKKVILCGATPFAQKVLRHRNLLFAEDVSLEIEDFVTEKPLQIEGGGVYVLCSRPNISRHLKCLRQSGVAWEQIKSYQLLLLLEPEYSTNPYAYQYDKILEQIKDLVYYAEEYHQIYLNLADDKSKDIFLKMILFRLTYDVRMHDGNATQYAHYFDEDIISLDKQEIFVDCGGYMGDTLEAFRKVYDNQFNKYYLFEPDPELFRIALAKGDGRVEFINKGVWKEEATLSFKTETANGNGMVLEGATDYETIEIKVTSLDDNIGRATFIKMDVEGSELNALVGAQNLIRNCQPKLAVCVYHKYEDFRELYHCINRLGKYRVYLRAEMDNVDTETYYLCIPQKEE